jgi:hypothetical protein
VLRLHEAVEAKADPHAQAAAQRWARDVRRVRSALDEVP